MKKIITSGGILLAVVALVTGATTAYFSDTERSSGNTFASGAIDLTVDNESYYNGALSEATSWLAQDLDESGLLFFNFKDLKPDDEGEDTISLHVGTNDAYVCMDLVLTSDDDRSSNDPELDASDALEDVNDTWDGELADALQMFWWADDGDNVFECVMEGIPDGEGNVNLACDPNAVGSEHPITNGVQTVTNMFGPDKTFSAVLADSQTNAWGGSGPVPGNETHYIAKAWCFGALGLSPLAQDGLGTDGPLAPDRVGTGVTCYGNDLGNITQTDGVTMDVAFRAYQSRHVPGFLCNEDRPRTAVLTVIKEVINNNGGNNDIPDFQLFVVNDVVTNVTHNVATVLAADTYFVNETGVSGYVATFSGDCDSSGMVVLAPGDNKTCTITNDDLPAHITLVKSVVNDNGGVKVPAQFPLKIDGGVVPNGASVAVTSNSAHIIDETQQTGYHFVSLTGNAECPGVLGGTATLSEGQSITCTITNSDDGGAL